ncbi:hypothetical protein [Planococcus lenghuensis]|uniref:Uncharacterized protein n=1 Tax=Planococcus lenghuensis TaxID=2213202 RepID=A0A1Q2L4L4_9BACL|nr:hypothetical protein [Planococcus lenghuensis]AQQ55379.1 hypothetical protein B0X71_19610 [Planococcus lenghuensis]
MTVLSYLKGSLIWLIILLTGTISTPVSAATHFLPKEKPPNQVAPQSDSTIWSDAAQGLMSFFSQGLNEAIVLFTGLFLIGTFAMVFSVLLRNGQWQKFATQTMAWSFLALLLIRLIPLLAITIHSWEDVNEYLLFGIKLIATGVFLIGLLAIEPIADLFRRGDQLIAHPKYRRWAKNALGIAILMILLSQGFMYFYLKV